MIADLSTRQFAVARDLNGANVNFRRWLVSTWPNTNWLFWGLRKMGFSTSAVETSARITYDPSRIAIRTFWTDTAPGERRLRTSEACNQLESPDVSSGLFTPELAARGYS